MSMFRLPDEEALKALKDRIGSVCGGVRTIAPLSIKPAPKPAKSKPSKPRRPAEPILSESAEQKLLIRWFNAYATTVGLNPILLFAIPNGAFLAGTVGQRCAQMNTLKSTGLRAGIPDLFLAAPRQGAAGLFVEMKRRYGQATEPQIAVHEILRASGYRVEVCCGAEEGILAIKAYLKTGEL